MLLRLGTMTNVNKAFNEAFIEHVALGCIVMVIVVVDRLRIERIEPVSLISLTLATISS